MPYKDPERQKQAQRTHYLRNKELYIKRAVNWKHNYYDSTKRKYYGELPALAPTKEQTIISSGFVTSKILSDRYDISQREVRRACRARELKAKKIGQEYFINPLEGEQWCVWTRFYDIVLSKRPKQLMSIPSFFHINDIEVDIPSYSIEEVL